MNTYRRWLIGLLALLIVAPASGQSLRGQAEWNVSLWPQGHQRYWHSAQADLEGTFEWSWLDATLYSHIGAWGAAPSKWDNSQPNPLVAEFVRAIERQHGAHVSVRIGEWSVGAQVHRRAVHHVWRHRNAFGRHDYFPIGGNWKEGRVHCTDGDTTPVADWVNGDCPSLGYAERVGPRIANVEGDVQGWLTLLPFQYKTLTLPPSILRWGIDVRLNPKWQIEAEGSVEVTGLPYAIVELKRRTLGRMWASLRMGRRRDPGWKKGFWIIAFTVGSK